jgi:hypothetical protein
LTATIETPEEKKERENQERQDRIRRIQELEKRRVKKDKNEDEVFKSYGPNEDYQVIQAVRYLQGFNVFKETRTQK